MRGWALLAMILLASALAGCDKSPEKAQGPAATPAPEPERLVDNLTARLDPKSGPFFPDMAIEDAVDLHGGGRIEFAVGLGMRCQGNASSLAPDAAGWVTCSVRLASDPSARITSRRELELGFDYQILTQRAAAEPIEWSVQVESNGTGLFDSGWRKIDLSPRLDELKVQVAVDDPCDLPDQVEATAPPFGPAGRAWLNVSFNVSHALPTLRVDLGRSHPGPPATSPYAAPEPGDTNFTGAYPVAGVAETMRLMMPVDLEAPEEPDGSVGGCPGHVAHESQVWTIAVAYVGADGRNGLLVLPVTVEVDLKAAPV